ncbi:angiopoietin-related protein 1-like [Watersipora subatra]|uniref:angiopoietin-related protein 1-like n=1 Tax=Watersipora subatra TaxID=2589382 RepID=UPI00355AF835
MRVLLVIAVQIALITANTDFNKYERRWNNAKEYLNKGTWRCKRLYKDLVEELKTCQDSCFPLMSDDDLQFRDCQHYYEKGHRVSGRYEINPPDNPLPPFSVWCDFMGGHGWTAIQRNINGPVNFTRLWDQYKEGFGDISDEHWLGNEKIHILTQTNQMLNIYLTSEDKSPASGTWTRFEVANESANYQLTLDGSGYTGELIDYFSLHHDGMQFSTADNDNDIGVGNRSCAADHQAGWWYAGCGQVGLNSESQSGMFWKDYYPSSTSIMRVSRD